MDQPSSMTSARALLRTRLALGACGVSAAAALGAGALPLFEVPGFELGLAMALSTAIFLGPALGIAAARRELSMARAGPPSVLRPFAATALVLTLALLVLFGAAALRAAATTPCRALAAAAPFAAVALPSALLSSALGVGCGLVARGRRVRAALLYALLALASLTATLLTGYLGPSASLHDHLLGVWPGPLYDEAIEVDQRLLLFRAGTLAWTGAILAAAALARPRQEGPRRRAVAAALAASLGAALLARGAGGGPVSRAEIANVLGGQLSGPRCTVHFPREKTPGEADRILRDCEYDAAAVTGDLGLGRPPRAVVWIYRGAEEKRRLVGAGRTSFTKPWLAEVHVNDEGTPHPVLRHELVHALASAAATGPLGVPARAGVLVNAGLIEGLAVAVEVPAGPYSVHQWTRALRDQGRLPPLASLLGWSGFFSAAPARAYTAAGSFLRYLIDRYGSAPVLGAYRRDDVARALGRPLPELEAEWQRFLDGVVAPPALAALAEARFERGSLFARVCAREVAQLEADASRAAAASRAADSERLLRRASALSGGDPGLLRGAADAWRSAGDLARAEAIAGEALASAQAAGGHRALRASFLGLLGDLRLRSRDPAAAAERYRSALALGVEGAEARALHAKLAAAEDPDLADEVAPWLLGVGDPELALARAARGDRALAHYLLARARLARGAPSRALHDLHGLVPSSLPHPALAEEARRMTASALCLGGRWGEGIAAWTAIAREASGDGARAAADDAARRCAFEREEYGAPAAWEGDW